MEVKAVGFMEGDEFLIEDIVFMDNVIEGRLANCYA
jgi:hypothetical protein